jgi:hypothetical protein
VGQVKIEKLFEHSECAPVGSEHDGVVV